MRNDTPRKLADIRRALRQSSSPRELYNNKRALREARAGK